jgi:hypothetical protein
MSTKAIILKAMPNLTLERARSGPPINLTQGPDRPSSSSKNKEYHMTKRQQLLQHIASLQSHVESQQVKYDVATKCLAQTQAAIAVTKMASQMSGGPPLTPKDFLEFNNALSNTVQGVTDAIASLGEMRRELQELKDALIMLPE